MEETSCMPDKLKYTINIYIYKQQYDNILINYFFLLEKVGFFVNLSSSTHPFILSAHALSIIYFNFRYDCVLIQFTLILLLV